MMRPVFLDFPEIFAPNSGGFDHLDTEFLLGPSLLVAPPPFAETLDDYAVSFPKDHEWYDFWTGLKAPPSPQAPPIAAIVTALNLGAEISWPRSIHPPLETMPVYVRDGSIIPIQPLIQNTDETPKGPLELHVYPGPQCRGSIYLDDGHTFRYQQGEYLRQTLTCQSDGNSVSVNFGARQGSYAPWWKFFEVVIYDWPSAHAEAKVSGSTYPLKTSYDAKQHALHVTLADVSAEAELRIRGRSDH
jgi:alpha-glucosidase